MMNDEENMVFEKAKSALIKLGIYSDEKAKGNASKISSTELVDSLDSAFIGMNNAFKKAHIPDKHPRGMAKNKHYLTHAYIGNINEIRKNVGIVFQNPDNQFVGVTVKDDIAFGMENRQIEYKEMEKRIDYYSKLVGMNEFLDRNPESLSGGQKQRVAISSVLAFEPEIIILDEATSMLDPLGVKEVNDTIKSLIGKKTILAITHNLNEAIYADRVIVLNNGEITLNGTPFEVFKEKEKLKEANLDITDSMKLLELIEKSNIKDKEKLRSILWELTFQK